MCVHKQKKRHFHAKATSAKLYIYNGVGARDLYIDEAHKALDIFRFAAFFLFEHSYPPMRIVGFKEKAFSLGNMIMYLS